MQKSQEVKDLAAALAAAQGEMRNPPLDATNPHFRSRYASLAGVRDAVLPVLARHGLSVVQSVGATERGPALTTLLLHRSGQWVETDALALPAGKQDAQGYGSAITYARRYALMALAGVVGDEDDDGEASVRRPAGAAAAQKAKRPGPPAQAVPAAVPVVPASQLTAPSVLDRVERFEARMREEGLCSEGELLAHLEARYGAEMGPLARWPESAAEAVASECRAFKAAKTAGRG